MCRKRRSSGGTFSVSILLLEQWRIGLEVMTALVSKKTPTVFDLYPKLKDPDEEVGITQTRKFFSAANVLGRLVELKLLLLPEQNIRGQCRLSYHSISVVAYFVNIINVA